MSDMSDANAAAGVYQDVMNRARGRASSFGVVLSTMGEPPDVRMPDGAPFRGMLPAGWGSYGFEGVQILSEAIYAWRSYIGMVAAEATAELSTIEDALKRAEATIRTRVVGAQKDKDNQILINPALDRLRIMYAEQSAFVTIVRQAVEIASSAHNAVSRKQAALEAVSRSGPLPGTGNSGSYNWDANHRRV